MAFEKNKKKRGFWGWILRLCALVLAYLLLCKFIMPPITITQTMSLLSGDGLHRDYVRAEKIPPHVRLAAIASEDQLFPEHEGIDWKAMEKSLEGKRLKRNKTKGAGASTISQQTAKNVFLWQGSGWTRYVRKVPELIFTKLIEWVWGKKRILHVYLNVIETGKGVYGIEAAAQRYFGKSAAQLTRAEAAMIVSSLPNPKVFTVKPLSRRVAWRYPQILRQMNYLEGQKEIQELIR